MMPYRLLLPSLFIIIFNIAGHARAEISSLRVVDEHGLIRAESPVATSATIEITVKPSDSASKIALSNIDGFKSEKGASSSARGHYIFNSVPPGTWKIIGTESVILSVKIIPNN